MSPANDKGRSSAASAVEQLRQLIFDGELAAGSNHLESELAEMLGLSRTPVREAALSLEAQGLIEVRPRKGVRILPLSPSDMRDVYDVLTALEGLAAANAAKAGLDRDDLAGLAASIDDMDTALATEDRRRWATADDAFHTELVRLGGNSRVVAIVGMMADQVRRARAVTLFIRPLPTQSNNDHRAVLDAILAGDADAAQQIHTAHRTMAKAVLLDLLEKHQLQRL